jgi:hypothetical protein
MLTNDDLRKIGDLIDNKLKDFARKDDLKDFARKKDLRGMVRRKDLRLLENRMMKRINIVADFFDPRIITLESRTNRIEKHLNLLPLN